MEAFALIEALDLVQSTIEVDLIFESYYSKLVQAIKYTDQPSSEVNMLILEAQRLLAEVIKFPLPNVEELLTLPRIGLLKPRDRMLFLLIG